MPIVYHLVCAPLSVTPCICTWIQEPSGVEAFQDATSSVIAIPGVKVEPVHV